MPIVLAPLAGGPSTVELALAVTRAGGLGFVAGGYLPASELEARLVAFRFGTDRPLAVNLFVPNQGPAAPALYAPYLDELRSEVESSVPAGYPSLGEPRWSDDEWAAKLELLERIRPEVVSFTFGCPASEVLAAVAGWGGEAWVTVTDPQEAVTAVAAGAHTVVVQGAEAGGHRASFVDDDEAPLFGLLSLIALTRAEVRCPVVASGGIATGAAVAAVLAAGARAAQIGTAFLLAPEAGTSEVHRAALDGTRSTVLTRAFTGRLARGLRNGFTDAHSSAPAAYPEIHYVTAPLRSHARSSQNPELVNLWAGQSHPLARPAPAARIVERLVRDARQALDAAQTNLEPGGPVLDPQAVDRLVTAWYADWNAHDLDAILTHYAENATFSSPFIAALGIDPSGRLTGRPALRAYWQKALDRYPDLRFEPIATMVGVGSVTLHYRGVAGLLAAEVLELRADGLIHAAAAHYDRT